jgi:hypothetical protein
MKTNPRAILQEEQGEAILFDPENLATLWLNETGILIWKSICQGLSEIQILNALNALYENLDEKEVLNDIKTTMESLQTFGFIHP